MIINSKTTNNLFINVMYDIYDKNIKTKKSLIKKISII